MRQSAYYRLTYSEGLKLEVKNTQRQVIKTKYLGATTHRGVRIKAVCSSGLAVTVGYDYELDDRKNHDAAAKKLATNLGWEESGQLVGGRFSSDDCYYVSTLPNG